MGLNFFREVMKIQNKCNTYGASIINSVQTNLTLMTPEYIRFFTENKFGISTSFDGLKNEDLRHNTTQFFEKKQLLNDNGENVE
jgi:sulfatase maturation enzyme AslB (radical SAM superfamily)